VLKQRGMNVEFMFIAYIHKNNLTDFEKYLNKRYQENLEIRERLVFLESSSIYIKCYFQSATDELSTSWTVFNKSVINRFHIRL